ncbi:formate dehydrogenase accessory sulfurtransferase FdhD [Ornatilinea apprima]|uniref:formate dehydrogenase accessory sulfurtransferase FdhD n=1 Tax=Ornatilinea apprima TaxID=1134406 RepID=UPI00094660F6|nr:formate dehydrogenase accessory sulfurtransferase FdhD [Ornatilinea apprima]
MLPGSETIRQMHFNLRTRAWVEMRQQIITEKSIALKVNGEQWLSFICSPFDLEALAVGFLYNEDIISSVDQIQHIQISLEAATIDVQLQSQVVRPEHWHRTTTGLTFQNPLAFSGVKDSFKISAERLITLYEQFSAGQVMHQAMGGFHSAAMSDGKQINIAVEDVGRHNALDKITGHFLLKNRPFIPRLILLTGRVSSEMIHKAIRSGICILVSRTTPTYNAVQTAHHNNITLVGYMRKDCFTAYTYPERIILE